jgi:hypothetical protein
VHSRKEKEFSFNILLLKQLFNSTVPIIELRYKVKSVAGNQKEFKTTLKKLLYTYSFYTMEEYFNQL